MLLLLPLLLIAAICTTIQRVRPRRPRQSPSLEGPKRPKGVLKACEKIFWVLSEGQGPYNQVRSGVRALELPFCSLPEALAKHIQPL